MASELGAEWRDRFLTFDDKPFSAASIGQVHRATTLGGSDVVVKVQYPGVAESISSDLGYLRSLLTASSFLPKGLFLDNTIKVASSELAWECDYLREGTLPLMRFILHATDIFPFIFFFSFFFFQHSTWKNSAPF
jgi:aarF domain-containing kinase